MAAVLLALGAALGYAAASVLQQREAEADTGSDQGGAVGGGFRLVLRLARRPIWLAGLGADGVGYVFQALALGVGELLVVQPVLTSGILFALPAGAWWAGRRLSRADFAWACVLAAGLTAWTRRNFARWMFEDYPRAALLTPSRWRRRRATSWFCWSALTGLFLLYLKPRALARGCLLF